MEPTYLIPGANGGQYPYFLGDGQVFGGAISRFVENSGHTSVALITNETVLPLYGEEFRPSLPGSSLIVIPDGEQYKTLQTAKNIYRELTESGAGRNTLIVALGGGVVGDIAGYAAATFMRGLPFIHVPTTLLAMVDASIGGKVGVNLPQGKNLVGAFKDPLAVFADISTLGTLPKREFLAGLAEVVKSALVSDPALFEMLEESGTDSIEEIIKRTAKVKIDIVAQDPLEKGTRAYLNLGHTFGHALEVESGYRLSHGEAVAIGITAAARLSHAMGFSSRELYTRIEALMQALELPVRCTGAKPEALWQAMSSDKKNQNGMRRFVLLEDISKPKIVDDVPKAAVIETLEAVAK